MAHYGLLGKYEVAGDEDIRGAAVYGQADEKLGKIDDVIFDHSIGDIRYVVVDTGGWLKSKKFLVPANRLRASAKHEGNFESGLTKPQIETFPPFKESDLESEDRWADYEGRYRAKWKADPVMHRAETDRNITPTTSQLEGNPVSLRASGSAEPNRPVTQAPDEESLEAADEPTERVVGAGMDSVVIDNSAVGIGGRWDTFQARLRERRKQAVAGCRTCSGGPQSVKDSADTLKKAI